MNQGEVFWRKTRVGLPPNIFNNSRKQTSAFLLQEEIYIV